MTALPEPSFIERDPVEIERQVFETWEDLGGGPLEPGQPESLFLRSVAYREALVRIAIQDAAKLNLLRYSRFPILDYLGELVGAPRLPAAHSLSTVRLTRSNTALPTTAPAGWLVRTKDGRSTFELTQAETFSGSDATIDVSVRATDPGAQANDYAAGQLSVVVDPAIVPNVASAVNLTTTTGGAPIETDEAYIQRLLLAPAAYSTAGPEAAYRFHALGASSAIVDVQVLSPAPGEIELVVLASGGAPSPEQLELVEAAVNAEDIRPMTDTVTVIGATEVTWGLEATLTLYADADAAASVSAAAAAIAALDANRRARLGRDVTRSQLFAALQVEGVYEITIISPAATVAASETDFLRLTTSSITVAGTVDEEA